MGRERGRGGGGAWARAALFSHLLLVGEVVAVVADGAEDHGGEEALAATANQATQLQRHPVCGIRQRRTPTPPRTLHDSQAAHTKSPPKGPLPTQCAATASQRPRQTGIRISGKASALTMRRREDGVVETDKRWLIRAQDVDVGGTRAVHAHDQDGRLTECQRKRMTQKGSEMAGGVCGKHRLSGGSSRAKRDCLLFWRAIEHIKSRDLQVRIEVFGGLCRTRIALHQPGRSRGARRSHCTGPG